MEHRVPFVPIRRPSFPAAERALRGLRLLWRVPALLLCLVAALLVFRDTAALPPLGRGLCLGLAVAGCLTVPAFISRHVRRLARTLRTETARETARLEASVQQAEERLAEQSAVSAAARDTAENSRQREGRRAQEFDAALSGLSDGVVVFDAAGGVVSANQAAQALLGPDDLRCGESIEAWSARIELCYPSGQAVPPGAVPPQRALRTGAATEWEEFRLGARAVELTSVPVAVPEGGEVVGAVAVLRDVTDLRRSRRQEVVSEARAGALAQTGRRLSATHSDSEVGTIVTEGALALLPSTLTPGARALLYGRDDETRLTLLATAPEEKPKRPRTRRQAEPLIWKFDVQSPLLWEVYVQRLPVVSGEVGDDARFSAPSDRLLLQGHAPAPPDVRSVLLLPLVAGSAVGGHLMLTSPAPHAFDDPCFQDALTSLASLATLARASVHLHGHARQRAEELDALWAVGRALVTQVSLRDLADTLTERVQSAVGAELCTLSLWEPAPSGERVLRRQGARCDDALLPEGDGRPFPACDSCDGVTHQAALQGEVTTRLGVSNPPFGGCRWRAFSGQSGTHTVLAVPLRRGGDVLGALTVYRPGDVPFRPEQIQLLQTAAALASAAVSNALTNQTSRGAGAGTP